MKSNKGPRGRGQLPGSADKLTRLVRNPQGERVASVSVGRDGTIAAQIEALAASCDIPLLQDALLTGLLVNVDQADEIPEDLYAAIAEVLGFLYES